jgi:hypothetical protein
MNEYFAVEHREPCVRVSTPREEGFGNRVKLLASREAKGDCLIRD